MNDMKHTLIYICMLAAAACMTTACENDDTDFSSYINGTTSGNQIKTIYISYDGSSVSISGDDDGYVTASGADVTVSTGTANDSLLLVLSGSTGDGSLLVYRSHRYGIRLNGVSIANGDGPAINNQCGKALYVEVADGTTNTLSDGTSYDESVSYQQKGTLFSEGQLYFLGGGTLSVTANGKNGIASDDYIVLMGNTAINDTVMATGSNGIKANDGIYILSGSLHVGVASQGGRGIKCDSLVHVSGGDTRIYTSGAYLLETSTASDGSTVRDTTSAAGIKCDADFTIVGGSLSIYSTGDGGKGLNSSKSVSVSGGNLWVRTVGSNTVSKPKGVKGDEGITVSGGTFYSQVRKSWACDNGYESDDEADQAAHCVTIPDGATPTTKTLTKSVVRIEY